MTEIDGLSTGLNPVDNVPEGTFLAGEYGPDRIAALRKVISLGNELSGTHPEVAELYRDTDLTYLEIAQRIIPEEVAISEGVAQKAIGVAVRSLLSEEEQAEITAKRRAKTLNRQQETLGEEGFREHQREAARRRHELHGVNTDAMIRARGRTPWTEAEKRLVLEICSNPEFQHQQGNRFVKGSPNYSNIAFAVNELIHDGKEVRHANSVRSLVADTRRKVSSPEGTI